MRTILNQALSVLLLAAFAAGVLAVSAADSSAQQSCAIVVTKAAPGAEGLEFRFEGEEEGGTSFEFTLITGVPLEGFASPIPAVITEVPRPGWEFGGIECEPGGGVEILEVLENGWVEVCVNPELETFCTISNVSAPANIPTLSGWGMMAAAGGLMLIGAFYAVRRRKARA